MSRFQLNVIHHNKTEENFKLNKKRQSIDANNEMADILEFSDNNFKASMIKLLQQAILDVLETNK